MLPLVHFRKIIYNKGKGGIAVLERAKYLLANSQTTVDEISDSLGFGTGSCFTSVFKKHTGQTPSEYRREHSLV